MRIVPNLLSADWIDALTDDELLDVERRTHQKFVVIERREKKLHGDGFRLMRGSAALLDAWNRWGRISSATRERRLRPIRAAVVSE